MSHYTSQKGFTLVELAIALMVIGLLIGGVLKGQELIENARVTQTIRDLKGYDAAVLIFRNTYGALPGDIKKPSRIAACTDSVCNLGGNGNGKVGDDGNGYELANFFPHLSKAGLINGPQGGSEDEMNEVMSAYQEEMLAGLQPDDTFMLACVWNENLPIESLNDIITSSGKKVETKGPKKGESLSDIYAKFYPPLPFDDVMISVAANADSSSRASHNYSLRSLPLRVADAMDSKLDDGSATSGDMLAKDEQAKKIGHEGKKLGYDEMYRDSKEEAIPVSIRAMY